MKCPECGNELTTLISGFYDCGPHTPDDFDQVKAIVVPGDIVFMDFENPGESPIIIPIKRLLNEEGIFEMKDVFVARKGCCARVELDPECENWCPICQDEVDPVEELS